MNPHLAGALRNAFEELAEAAPAPVGLARAALVSARRQRITRLSVGGAFAAVCAALIGVVTAIAPISGTADDQFAGNELKPFVVTAHNGIYDPKIEDRSLQFQYSLLLNPKTGRYDRVPYRYAMPSPDGSRVLVATGDNSPIDPAQVGVLDRASGNVRWVGGTGFISDPGSGRWSPDGRRILFTDIPGSGTPGFVLMDPETLETTFVPLPDLATWHGALMWADSNSIALELSRPLKGKEATGVRFYDLTGKVVRTVPVNGSSLAYVCFSPDGGQMALLPDYQTVPQTSVSVIDPVTGAVRNRFEMPDAGDLIGWADDQHVLIRNYRKTGGSDASGQPLVGGPGDFGSDLLVVDLTGRVTHSMYVPNEYSQFFVGSSAGLPRSAAKITF
jgi:hypothetical protein